MAQPEVATDARAVTKPIVRNKRVMIETSVFEIEGLGSSSTGERPD
jgi:hypothetical protein